MKTLELENGLECGNTCLESSFHSIQCGTPLKSITMMECLHCNGLLMPVFGTEFLYNARMVEIGDLKR